MYSNRGTRTNPKGCLKCVDQVFLWTVHIEKIRFDRLPENKPELDRPSSHDRIIDSAQKMCDSKQVAHMQRGPSRQQKKTTPRLACVL
jgi:hypothetical protein